MENNHTTLINMDNMAANSPAVRRTKSAEFPIKLYALLELADSVFEFAQAVTWLPHGRAFAILDKVKFMEDVVPLFFNQTKIRSFSRQLHLWGFRRIGRGKEHFWYHVNFLRGKPENMKLMVRTKIKGNLFSRETVIDEPNFEDLPPLPSCDKRPAAVLDVMEAVILKLPASASIAVDRCVSNKPTVSTPNLGSVTAGNNHPMVLQRTETPFQLNTNCNQDECLPPPPFQRAVSNEGQGQVMMTHCVPAMVKSYHSPLQVSSYGSTPPSLEMHETSSQELQNHHAEHYQMLHGNLNCENGDDFEPLPFAFQDDNPPCDDFAAFIEGAIQQVGTR